MDIQHITVYREPGRFAGWPANYGIWSWGAEIVVGFTLGYMKIDSGFHARDRDRPFVTMQARSLDGGQSWEAQPAPLSAPKGRGLSVSEHVNRDLAVGTTMVVDDGLPPCPGGIEFTHPGFALMCARTGLIAGARSWFYVSYDRCHTWQGPFGLPLFGQTGLAARTDYIISGPNECTLFLSAAKSDGAEGRPFCARTVDGGKTFEFLSYIGPEPSGFAIMPASRRLPDSRILVAIRCRETLVGEAEAQNWIDLYASDDNAATWRYLNRPVPDTGPGGNPPTLTHLLDGRLCLIYGYRGRQAGVRARLSDDDGATWGEEIVLRDDAGNHDIGYPRTVQRPDGTIVTAYYHNDHAEGERYIAATLWRA